MDPEYWSKIGALTGSSGEIEPYLLATGDAAAELMPEKLLGVTVC